jgi:DNA gyrase/topoisomerase IV subunit B
MADKLYDENSIKSLDPLQFTRLRPGVYAGSTEYATQTLIEIVSNAVDEFKAGHGQEIHIRITKDGTCIVRDFAQGFIVNSYREDGKTILQAAFDTLNTSGKFSDDGVYEGTALGLNGIGCKLSNFLSNWLTVTSYRDGEFEEVYFKEGVFESRESGKTKEPNGTNVAWLPSKEFFTSNKIEIPKIKELLHVLSCLCVGLTFKLDIEGEDEIVYSSQAGLNDLVDDKVGDSELINNRMIMNYSQGKNQIEMVMTYTSSYSLDMISYVNTGETDSGPHIRQIKTILTRELNKFFKEKKWLKDKDTNFSGDDVQAGLLVAFNITAPGVSYDAQTKSRIVKIDMTPFNAAISDSLQAWLHSNEKEVKIIFDKAASERKAREAAKKARDAARKPKAKGLKGKMELSDKFIDCVSKDPKERNLLLVEGLSAGGSTLEARNVQTDCIYMLRGKTISPLKQSIEKILANQEMSDIIKVIGAGFGNENFDVSKMQFDKIVITADQDSDGADIELLLITFFYTFMRPMVESGKLYRAVTPLYIIETSKEKVYCYSEKELDDWRSKNTNLKYSLMHCKGLGELDAQVLKEICFENQRFKRITVSDAVAAENLLEVLQGKLVTPRKQFIYDNATQLGFNFT